MKTCTLCKIEKPYPDFPKDKYAPGGVRTFCKECYAKRKRISKAANLEKLKEVWPRTCCVCKLLKPEEAFANCDKHLLRPRCRDCQSIKCARYKELNSSRISETQKARYRASDPFERRAKRAKHYLENREKILEERRIYHLQNAEKRCARQRKYHAANTDKAARYMLAYVKRRYAEDPLFALKMNMRGRINHVLAGNGWVKSRSNEKIFGCTYEFLLEYLTSLFTEGMSWENRSAWHIDHKIPLASAKTREEMYALCHYTNLQPLWASENMSKGAKIM